MLPTHPLRIAATWQGAPIPDHHQVQLSLCPSPNGLLVEIDAPDWGDPPPPGPAGSTDGLWNYEVVELFVGDGGPRYTEIELGPHGHYLVLCFDGIRQRRSAGHALDWAPRRAGGRWTGRVRLPPALVDYAPLRVNAYAIHGPPTARSYLAWSPVPGLQADFHQPDRFRPLPAPGA